MSKFDGEAIETAISMIIKAIGEDCNRQGLRNTPKRVAKMYEEIFSGINANLEDQIQVTVLFLLPPKILLSVQYVWYSYNCITLRTGKQY